MDTTMPSAAAPRLVAPWRVVGVEFRDADAGGREPRITIGYGPGSRFHRPEAGCGEASCPVHDTMERTWRHLNLFRYKAFIHASVPRVACPERGEDESAPDAPLVFEHGLVYLRRYREYERRLAEGLRRMALDSATAAGENRTRSCAGRRPRRGRRAQGRSARNRSAQGENSHTDRTCTTRRLDRHG